VSPSNLKNNVFILESEAKNNVINDKKEESPLGTNNMQKKKKHFL
jgi:hypothetical protein